MKKFGLNQVKSVKIETQVPCLLLLEKDNGEPYEIYQTANKDKQGLISSWRVAVFPSVSTADQMALEIAEKLYLHADNEKEYVLNYFLLPLMGLKSPPQLVKKHIVIKTEKRIKVDVRTGN